MKCRQCCGASAAVRGSLPVRGAWVEIASAPAVPPLPASLPVRGAWVEMVKCGFQPTRKFAGRSPCGERGLKSENVSGLKCCQSPSLPVRGAWVEIVMTAHISRICLSRSPCGERGLKYCCNPHPTSKIASRSPCGERGLKFVHHLYRVKRIVSLPVRGAWVEITNARICRGTISVAPRAGSVG